jgi:hypothetical protein
MNVFTYSFYSNWSPFEQNRYEKTTKKKIKEWLTSVTAKLTDANYFLWKK